MMNNMLNMDPGRALYPFTNGTPKCNIIKENKDKLNQTMKESLSPYEQMKK